jgi:hypothetical protein
MTYAKTTTKSENYTYSIIAKLGVANSWFYPIDHVFRNGLKIKMCHDENFICEQEPIFTKNNFFNTFEKENIFLYQNGHLDTTSWKISGICCINNKNYYFSFCAFCTNSGFTKSGDMVLILSEYKERIEQQTINMSFDIHPSQDVQTHSTSTDKFDRWMETSFYAD